MNKESRPRILHHQHRDKWRLYLEQSPLRRVLLITGIFGDFNPLYIRLEIGDNGAPEGRGTVNQSGYVLREVHVDVRLMRETLCGFVSKSSIRVRQAVRSRDNADAAQDRCMGTKRPNSRGKRRIVVFTHR